MQWFERELARPYWLARVRAIVDSAEILRQAPVKAHATTAEEARRARKAAAPGYLRARVEGDRELPGVEVVAVATHTVDSESELVMAVTHHVIGEMKEDPFLVLLQFMRYTTPEGWAPRAEGQGNGDYGDEMQSEDGDDDEEDESVYDEEDDDDYGDDYDEEEDNDDHDND